MLEFIQEFKFLEFSSQNEQGWQFNNWFQSKKFSPYRVYMQIG